MSISFAPSHSVSCCLRGGLILPRRHVPPSQHEGGGVIHPGHAALPSDVREAYMDLSSKRGVLPSLT